MSKMTEGKPQAQKTGTPKPEPMRIYVKGAKNADAVAYELEEHCKSLGQGDTVRDIYSERVLRNAYRAGIEVCEVETWKFRGDPDEKRQEMQIKSTRTIGGEGEG